MPADLIEIPEPAVTKAAELGHTVEWDPPAALTAVRRWTCIQCGGTALDNRGHIYGDATEKTCEEVKAYWAEPSW